MKTLASIFLINALGIAAKAAEIVPNEKVYRTPDHKLVKVTEVRSRADGQRCRIGELPQRGGLNVLEDLGWIDCSELKAVRARQGNEYPYAEDANALNESGEMDQLSGRR